MFTVYQENPVMQGMSPNIQKLQEFATEREAIMYVVNLVINNPALNQIKCQETWKDLNTKIDVYSALKKGMTVMCADDYNFWGYKIG